MVVGVGTCSGQGDTGVPQTRRRAACLCLFFSPQPSPRRSYPSRPRPFSVHISLCLFHSPSSIHRPRAAYVFRHVFTRLDCRWKLARCSDTKGFFRSPHTSTNSVLDISLSWVCLHKYLDPPLGYRSLTIGTHTFTLHSVHGPSGRIGTAQLASCMCVIAY